MKTTSPLVLALVVFCASLSMATTWQDVPLENGVEAPPIQEGDLDALAVEEVFPNGMEDQYLELQTAATKVQLEKLKRELGLDDKWADTLQELLKEDIAAAAKRIAEENDGNFGFSMTQSLETELRGRMWELVEERLSDDKKDQFALFREQDEKLHRLRDETGINGLIVFLDNELCLTEPQVDRLSELYSKNWNSSRNDEASMMVTNGMMFGRGTLEIVSNENMEEILSKKQFEIYEKMDESSNLMMMLQMGAMGGSETVDMESVKSSCVQSLDLKIDEYEQLVGLSEKQSKLLRVARKGAIAKVVSRMNSVLETIRENPDAMNGMNIEVMSALTESMIAQCTRTNAWQKTLLKAFEGEQLEKVQQREARRDELAMNQMLNYIVFSLTSMQGDLGLTAEQHEGFVALFREQLRDEPRLDLMTLAKMIFSIPGEKFEAILTDDQWARFEPMLDMQRQQMEMMEEAEEEAVEEDAEDR